LCLSWLLESDECFGEVDRVRNLLAIGIVHCFGSLSSDCSPQCNDIFVCLFDVSLKLWHLAAIVANFFELQRQGIFLLNTFVELSGVLHDIASVH